MRSKVITSLTLILLLFSANNAPLAISATAKAGGVCPKEKTTTLIKGVNYKCTKSGNKLTWQKTRTQIARSDKSEMPDMQEMPASPAASAKPSASSTPTSNPSQSESTGKTGAALTTPEYLPKPPDGGSDEYRCFLLDPKFAEDTFLNSVTITPGNLNVSHHGILYRLAASSVAATQKLDQESQTLAGHVLAILDYLAQALSREHRHQAGLLSGHRAAI